MTDMSVIKMIISVAVWRIYPSWVNDKLWAWERLCHSEMFWARLSRDDFRSKLGIISFLFRVMFISKSFLISRAFVNFGAKRSKPWDSLFQRYLGALFESCAPSLGIFLQTPTPTMHEYFLKISILFFKAEPVLLAWQLCWSPGWGKLFGDGFSKTRMETWFPGVGEIERRRTVDRRCD